MGWRQVSQAASTKLRDAEARTQPHPEVAIPSPLAMPLQSADMHTPGLSLASRLHAAAHCPHLY